MKKKIMKKYKLFFIIIFYFGCDDIGTGYLWQGKPAPGFTRNFGTIGYDYGWSADFSIVDEGMIIAGQRSTSVNSQTDLWAIKTNSRGTMEWEKIIGGNQNDVGYDVINTSDGGFLFTGYSWSYGNEQQVYVIKTDFYGKTEWEKTFGGSMWDVGNAVIEIQGGGYIIAGYSNSPGISSGNTDMYLIKIDPNGKLIWQKAYGNKAFPNHEWASDLIELPDLGLLVVGTRDRYDKGSLNGLVVRLDRDGKLIWEKEFIDNSKNINESIYSISSTNGGNYFLCSSTNSIEGSEIYQPKITKIDASGNTDWQRTFNSDSRNYHQFRARTTFNGDLIIVGTTGQELSIGHNEDAFMTKIDDNGNIIWSHSYGTPDESDWGWDLFETNKNSLVVIGSTKSFGASLFDILLMETNSNGISQ